MKKKLSELANQAKQTGIQINMAVILGCQQVFVNISAHLNVHFHAFCHYWQIMTPSSWPVLRHVHNTDIH
jgi:hypothetical protein